MIPRAPVSYARYMLGDYLLRGAALPTAMVVVLAGMPILTFGTFSTARDVDFAQRIFTSVVTLFLPFGAFVAATGTASMDRWHGYTRFVFAKPVNVLAYYLQAYCIRGVAFVALFGLLTWAFGALTMPQPVLGAMAAAALTFVLVGGMGFLFGALFRFDGIVLAVVYAAALMLQDLARAPGAPVPEWARLLARVLPPVVSLDDLRNHLYAGDTLAGAPLSYVIAYGGGAFVLGLVALRYRPLSR